MNVRILLLGSVLFFCLVRVWGNQPRHRLAGRQRWRVMSRPIPPLPTPFGGLRKLAPHSVALIL